MPTRTNPLHEAARLGAWQLTEVGRDIRVARLMAGRRQCDVARAVGTSVARISRLERGLVRTVSHRQLTLVAAAVGLKLYVRTYPSTRRVLDEPQLLLLAELRRRSDPRWQWATEVPMPIAGDLRAADARATIPGCTITIELWTRLADVQAQTRAALLKARDLRADRCLVVLAATRANRQALSAAGRDSLASFPLGTRDVLRALAEGRDPGDNGLILLRIAPRLPPRITNGQRAPGRYPPVARRDKRRTDSNAG